jgi:hypothetical protein
VKRLAEPEEVALVAFLVDTRGRASTGVAVPPDQTGPDQTGPDQIGPDQIGPAR